MVAMGTGSFLDSPVVRNLPVMQGTLVKSLGQEDPLEKGKATLSSILACIVYRVAKR